jgi:hypothetical protein
MNDDGKPNLQKRQFGMKGYQAVLIDDEREEYDLRATYVDQSPLKYYDSDDDEPEIFTSNNLRSKLKFTRHVKRLTKREGDDEGPPKDMA